MRGYIPAHMSKTWFVFLIILKSILQHAAQSVYSQKQSLRQTGAKNQHWLPSHHSQNASFISLFFHFTYDVMGYFLLSGTMTGWEKIYIFIFLLSTLHDDDDYKNNKLKTFCATCHSIPRDNTRLMEQR